MVVTDEEKEEDRMSKSKDEQEHRGPKGSVSIDNSGEHTQHNEKIHILLKSGSVHPSILYRQDDHHKQKNDKDRHLGKVQHAWKHVELLGEHPHHHFQDQEKRC